MCLWDLGRLCSRHWQPASAVAARKIEEIEEIQQIQQLYYDSLGTTVEYIRRRDSLISRLLPSLRDDGLVPTYPAKFVEELCVFFHYDEETRNFWNNYCYPLSLYVERATDQTAFIKRKVAERTDILSTAARREHRLGR